jgi:dihydrofolate reductase
MIISILASTSTGGIGNKGTLPWPHNKEDMRWFAQHTTGNIVVMGRNTWDDPKMPKPLPNRINVVVSNTPITNYQVRRIHGNISAEVLTLQQQFPERDLYIIGGKQIYEDTADIIDRVILTRVKGNYWADTRIQLERYLAPFRIKTVRPGTGCTYEIWDRDMFFRVDNPS